MPKEVGVTPHSRPCWGNLPGAKSQSIPRGLGDAGLCQYSTAVLERTFNLPPLPPKIGLGASPEPSLGPRGSRTRPAGDEGEGRCSSYPLGMLYSCELSLPVTAKIQVLMAKQVLLGGTRNRRKTQCYLAEEQPSSRAHTSEPPGIASTRGDFPFYPPSKK